MVPTKTLTSIIREEERKFPHSTGELSDLLTSIAVGLKYISHLVATAGFKGLYGYSGGSNIHQEKTRLLDLEADQVLVDVLGASGHFGLLVSEERDSVIETDSFSKDAKYVVAFDPLDGSSNIGSNIPVGTIFSIFRKNASHKEALKNDFMQPASALVAAGYAVYGAKTSFVYTTGNGVMDFTLDPTIGEFILTESNIETPEFGNIVSVNTSYCHYWDESIKNFVEFTTLPPEKKHVSPIAQRVDKEHFSRIYTEVFTSRYVGSLVADFDRTLRKGGIFLYPASSKHPKGRLRLLYEVAPLAFIAENAKGKAVACTMDKLRESVYKKIVDIVPEGIHQRSSIIVGSRINIEFFQKFIAG
jgi:fructose-1,6-bisphosphatase I